MYFYPYYDAFNNRKITKEDTLPSSIWSQWKIDYPSLGELLRKDIPEDVWQKLKSDKVIQILENRYVFRQVIFQEIVLATILNCSLLYKYILFLSKSQQSSQGAIKIIEEFLMEQIRQDVLIKAYPRYIIIKRQQEMQQFIKDKSQLHSCNLIPISESKKLIPQDVLILLRRKRLLRAFCFNRYNQINWFYSEEDVIRLAREKSIDICKHVQRKKIKKDNKTIEENFETLKTIVFNYFYYAGLDRLTDENNNRFVDLYYEKLLSFPSIQEAINKPVPIRDLPKDAKKYLRHSLAKLLNKIRAFKKI
jgi:hypothetical protein